MIRFFVIAATAIAGSGCGPTSAPPATTPPASTVTAVRGEPALRALLARRHYQPTKEGIARVSDQPAEDLRSLAGSDQGLGIVRMRAIGALALFPSDASVAALNDLVASGPRPALRRAGVAALGRMELSALTTATISALTNHVTAAVGDDDLQVRLAAVDALAALPNATPLLNDALAKTSGTPTRDRIMQRLSEKAADGVVP